jgi:glycosyltransferase involved in cell wall biosynthesis
MSRRLKVSVAMATYDGARFVEEQLASLAEQSRPPDELVVVDDASNDDTVARVEAFAAGAPFAVRVERNAENRTSTPTFERAFALCTGGIVFFADQDDVWHPEKVETLAGILESGPNVGAVFSDGRVVDAEREPMDQGLWQALWFDAREQALVRSGRAAEVFARHVVAAGTSLAFRASLRDLVLPFPGLRDCHDSWVAFLAAAVSEVRIVDRELIDYRVHGGNQFGIHRPSLLEQLELARRQVQVGAFRYGIDFFGAARARLRERGVRAPEVERLIDAKVEHCRRREAMSEGLATRVPLVLEEWLNGRYGRFSYGWKSVVQDLFLR